MKAVLKILLGGAGFAALAATAAPAAAQYGYPGQYGGQYGYGQQGYGGQYGYGQQGYQMPADARFDCTIDRYGRITDIDAKRYRGGYTPYRRY